MIKLIIDMFTDGILSAILGTILIILGLLLIGIILYSIYYCIDSVFRPTNESYGIIINKTFTPAHTETILVYNVALKMSIPQTMHYPDDWSITVKVKELIGNISINQKLYDNLSENDNVWTNYSTGRLNKNNIYIKSIRK